MKSLNLKQGLSFLLVLLMLAGTLLGTVACGTPDEGPDDETAGGTTEEDTSVIKAYDTVEKTKFDRDFIILTRGDLEEDMFVEKLTGNIMDDAIFKRNAAIENDFGVEIKVITEDGYEKINDTMKNQVANNLDEFDLYIGHKYSFSACAVDNYCKDLNQLTDLALTEEWWDQGCYDNLTVDGKTYLMTGDINPSSMRISACFTFNKKMMTNLQKSVDELNKLTAAGGWTLDVLESYTKDVTFDLNGDSNIEYTSDRYGLTSWMMDVPYSLYYGTGSKFIAVNDGTPEVAFTTAEVTDIYEKLYSIIVAQQAYYVTDEALYETMYDVFSEGRALFCDITLSKITTFISDMKDPYGILPTPKYDTYQKEYLSFVNGATALVMVAQTEKDTDFVGTIMEAMATYNYDNVTPNMFQVVTKLQAAQDPESAAMVDLIIRNRIYDLGYFCDYSITNEVRLGLSAKNENIASNLKSSSKSLGKELSKLMKAYSKH